MTLKTPILLAAVIICLIFTGCGAKGYNPYTDMPVPDSAEYVLSEPTDDIIEWKNNILSEKGLTEISLLELYTTEESLKEYKGTGFWILLATCPSYPSEIKTVNAYDANLKSDASVNMLNCKTVMVDVYRETLNANNTPLFWLNAGEPWLVSIQTDSDLIISPVSSAAKNLASSSLNEREYLEGFRRHLEYQYNGYLTGNHVYPNFSWR